MAVVERGHRCGKQSGNQTQREINGASRRMQLDVNRGVESLIFKHVYAHRVQQHDGGTATTKAGQRFNPVPFSLAVLFSIRSISPTRVRG